MSSRKLILVWAIMLSNIVNARQTDKVLKIKKDKKEISTELKLSKNHFVVGLDFLKNDPEKSLSYLNQKQIQSVIKLKPNYIKCETQGEANNCQNARNKINSLFTLTRNDEIKTKSLIGMADMIEEIGTSILQFQNKNSLVKIYTDSYLSISSVHRKFLPTPKSLSKLNSIQIKELMNKRLYPLLERINEGLISQNDRNENNWDNTSCDLAIGAKHLNSNTTDNADRCDYDELDDIGLIKNKSFALKNHLPCIKDQSNRGTCSAFAIIGALETKLKKNKKKEYNFSEQMTYFYNEIYANFSGRYEYGLNTMKAIKKLKNKKVKLPLEKYWVYNPSRYMGNYNSSTKKYPKSCNNYTGGKCTNRAFQATEQKTGLFNYEYTIPGTAKPYIQISSRNSFMNLLNKKGSLEQAITYLSNGEPIIISFGVRKNFSNAGGGDNYVRYAKRDNRGGHAAVLVGFIKNKDLPKDAEKASEKGYFILKNSWGKDWADCGYVYVDFKYMRKYAYGLAKISYSFID